ncbi:MAG TPA: arylesterase [Vicinamibacterales bacterium]|nr:arylesterase [Vicinamibacterales bacterium]
MRTIVLICVVVTVSSCGREPAPQATTSLKLEAGPPASTVVTPKPRIVFLGDSLTAGLGLPSDQSYPSLIGKKLKENGYDYEIVNAGVSGDTSAGGVRRLDWSLEGDVRALVVALGANDGLRGLPTDEMKKNLERVLDRAKERNIPVVLAGMEAPPNNGPEYTREFRQVYADLAKEYDVRFVPFLLRGVAGNASLNQGDGIHPNARGAEMVADLVWPELEPLVSSR